MKTYKLSRTYVIFQILSLGFFTLMAFFLLFWFNIDQPPSQRIPTLGGVGLLAVLGCLWYAFFLRVPHQLTIRDDKTVEFRGFLKRNVVMVNEIRSIEYSGLSTGMVDLKYEGGTIHLDNHVDGFYDFVGTLKSLNPQIVVKGC